MGEPPPDTAMPLHTWAHSHPQHQLELGAQWASWDQGPAQRLDNTHRTATPNRAHGRRGLCPRDSPSTSQAPSATSAKGGQGQPVLCPIPLALGYKALGTRLLEAGAAAKAGIRGKGRFGEQLPSASCSGPRGWAGGWS